MLFNDIGFTSFLFSLDHITASVFPLLCQFSACPRVSNRQTCKAERRTVHAFKINV